jgi:NAD(P)-dependent dehydrogenase (short-subunit alcohol dehydrogenase family)
MPDGLRALPIKISINMGNSYNNKVALVIGGTSGIGKATAVAFAKAGAKVVITGRREKEGTGVAAEITKSGGTAAFFRADVAKDHDVANTMEFVQSTHGRLDVAFNNAGVEFAGPLDQVTEEQYRRIFDISVWGVLNSMKHEIATMLKSGGGSIVNTSSVFGHIGAPQASIYVAAKHAVEGLTKAVALEFAKQGIRVNSVAPGVVDTEMIDRVVGKEADQRNWLRSLHPVGRLGTSEEIAAAVLYLASDAAKFTTGTTLLVDGGWTAA